MDPLSSAGFEEDGSSRNLVSPVRFVDMLLGRDRHWFEEDRSGALLGGEPRVVLKGLSVE